MRRGVKSREKNEKKILIFPVGAACTVACVIKSKNNHGGDERMS